jgi:hypothetical protein
MNDVKVWTAEDQIAVLKARARVYDAECALHAARQSHVDAWIAAAAEHLHHTLQRLDTAEKCDGWAVSAVSRSASS